jgi:hypothetical protein
MFLHRGISDRLFSYIAVVCPFPDVSDYVDNKRIFLNIYLSICDLVV